MKVKFLSIPVVLQKRLLTWGLGGVLSIIMIKVIWFFACDLNLIVPCILLTLFCVRNGWVLWECCIHHKYVVIEGVCTKIVRYHHKRHIKEIYIRYENLEIQIIGVRMIESLVVGDNVTAYVEENTDIYELNGRMVICRYLAIAKGGRINDDCGDIRKTR